MEQKNEPTSRLKNKVNYVKLLDEKIYEKKRVKVIVRFFEQDMVLLLVIKKHPKIDDNDFLFNFSSSAYFSANKGDDIYVGVRKELQKYKGVERWFYDLMCKRFPNFFDKNKDYEGDHSYDEYYAKVNGKHSIISISKCYSSETEKNAILKLFPEANPDIHDFCRLGYSYPCAEFHISPLKLPNPFIRPYPEACHLPYNILTRSYPIQETNLDNMFRFYQEVNPKDYQKIKKAIEGRDVYAELYVKWIEPMFFRVICQIFDDSK